ncbi:asparagine synthase-related protein [Streptomyces rubrolavendulae]|uniref:asparagine synthase (glutamine-hydrolyzing) n=1 Tax=Streptomyces rubrolavendulae TaxID=285473 RepID=A0A1D8FY91_9ACTN|nr:asparagine synthase-related protein [Streptomyces rubrolavendulae]AOT58136.1 Asparagine synthase [Streptomyces rubrolavendulae]
MEQQKAAAVQELPRTRGEPTRTVFDGPCRLTVTDDCGASRDELAQALTAVASHDWMRLTDWPGSYWVSAHAPDGTRFIAGDLAGTRPVYYTRHEHGDPTWAVHLGDLVELTGAAADLDLLVARLACGAQHWPHRTLYRGISLVPGGYGLVIARGEATVVDISGIRPAADLPAAAAAFGHVLTEAVQRPVRNAGVEVGADLSGGLDSATAVLLAAAVGPVRAVTYTDGHTSGEDASYAVRIAEHAGIPHEIAAGRDEHLPFRLDGVPDTDEPAADVVNWHMDRLYLAPVAGSPLHLTGHGGDVVLDASSAAWVGMIQQGEERAAKRHVASWARLRGLAPRPYWMELRQTAALGRAGVLLRAADALESAAPLTADGSSGWTWCRPGAAASWLTPYARVRAAAMLREAAGGEQPESADEAEQWAALRATGEAARTARALHAPIGVRPVYPFLDNQVVRAAFAVPVSVRRGVVTYKPLLAAALPSLPDWLTSRRTKGSFASQRIAGLERHRFALAQLIEDSPLVAAGLIDPAAARRTLLEAARGQSAAPIAELHQLIAACQWLTGRARSGPAGAREAAC